MKIGRGFSSGTTRANNNSAVSSSRGARAADAAKTGGQAKGGVSGDKIEHRPASSLMPEPKPPEAGGGGRFGFKATRLKVKEAFRPSTAGLEKKTAKYDARIDAGLDKRDQNVRQTVNDAGTKALTDDNVTRTVLSYGEQIKDAAVGPNVARRPAPKSGGETLVDTKTGKDATFSQGLAVGALDGFTAKSAERAGLSVAEYTSPGKRVKVQGTASTLPLVGDASKVAVRQNKLESDAKKADRSSDTFDELREQRGQEKAGTTVVHGTTRYYDPAANVDTPIASRADKVDFNTGLPDALNNTRRLDYSGTSAELKAGKNEQAIASQVRKRDAIAQELEAKFPQQHNETLQAWTERNAAQRQFAYEGGSGAVNGLINHRPDTHLGMDIGKGVGESVQPQTVANNLKAQARLDANAGEFAKTRGDLREIRKQEAFEDLTNAQSVGGDVFYDAAEDAHAISAIAKKSDDLADKALPNHTVLSPDGIQKEQLGLIPSSLSDASSRFFSNQGATDALKMHGFSAQA